MSETPQTPANDPPADDATIEPSPDPAPAEPSSDPTEPTGDSQAIRTEARTVQGRRVTTRRVDRREVTEYTQETITEDIPLEAYQGPGSAHPAPVG